MKVSKTNSDAYYNGLLSALERKDIVAVYQPIIDTYNNKVCAIEVLTRYTGDEIIIESPYQMVADYETYGMSCIFNTYMAKKIVDDVSLLDIKYRSGINIHVNFNIKSICSTGFSLLAIKLSSELKRLGCNLAIEVTEFQKLNVVAINVLEKLRSRGILIYIDDFGAGYSNLCYLLRLKIDGIKLDQVFLQDGMTEKNCYLIKMMIDMSRYLNLVLIFEGIENERQYKKLVDLEGRCQQGFYHSMGMKISCLYQYFKERLDVYY